MSKHKSILNPNLYPSQFCKMNNPINHPNDFQHDYEYIGSTSIEVNHGKHILSKIHSTCKYCGVLNTITQIEDADHSYFSNIDEMEGK